MKQYILFLLLLIGSNKARAENKIDLSVNDLISWLNDSTKIKYFRYHVYKNRQESSGWPYPTNLWYKNQAVHSD